METQPVSTSPEALPAPQTSLPENPSTPIKKKSKKWLIVTLVLFFLIVFSAFGYILNKNYQTIKKLSQETLSDASFTDIPFPTPVKESSQILFPMFPGATFSASSSAFIKNIHEKIPEAEESSSPAKPVVADAKYRASCEASGGKWYERKGKDLPMARCVCEYNDWREKNLENVVESGCDCSSDCKGTTDQFSDFDFLSITENPKPSITSPNPEDKYLIFKDEFSQCSFRANINNLCSSCTNDKDCGENGFGGNSRWLRYDIEPACVAGECKHRRVIYTEL